MESSQFNFTPTDWAKRKIHTLHFFFTGALLFYCIISHSFSEHTISEVLQFQMLYELPEMLEVLFQTSWQSAHSMTRSISFNPSAGECSVETSFFVPWKATFDSSAGYHYCATSHNSCLFIFSSFALYFAVEEKKSKPEQIHRRFNVFFAQIAALHFGLRMVKIMLRTNIQRKHSDCPEKTAYFCLL